jgi:hypothetical protein
MAYLTDWAYYENEGMYSTSNPDIFETPNGPENEHWGSYQYVPLIDVVNNYELIYTGNTSLVNNEERFKVLFHAKRAIQELNYDAFREIKALELKVCEDLKFILPHDYVNWVRVSMYRNGVLYPMTQNHQILHAEGYLQDNNCRILFDEDGYVLKPEHSNFDLDRIEGRKKDLYLNPGHPYHNREGYFIDGVWAFEYSYTPRFGLKGEWSNSNPTFRVNQKAGVINFNSDIEGELVILEYVSDGMEAGDDTKVTVNKMFEDYVYAYITWAILDSKLGVQEYVVRRAQKKKKALLNNAKIRIGNIHPGRLIMSLRGGDNWLK